MDFVSLRSDCAGLTEGKFANRSGEGLKASEIPTNGSESDATFCHCEADDI